MRGSTLQHGRRIAVIGLGYVGLPVAAAFARAVAERGTTTVVADPHEMANVAGLDGVRYLSQATPADWLDAPASWLLSAVAEDPYVDAMSD